MSRQAFYPHLSVDCVLIGFDEEGLKVLLVEKTQFEPGHTGAISKLPGDLIYEEEELDAAARRVLFDMTGMSSLTWNNSIRSARHRASRIRRTGHGWRLFPARR